MLELVLWIGFVSCGGVIYYVFDGYLRLLKLIITIAGDRLTSFPMDPKSRFFPSVTVLVTAYNEVALIKQRIDNILACNYPRDLMQVIVASDGSCDGTDGIVASYPDSRVQLFRPRRRMGKSATQNAAMREVRGEIIIFTDTDTQFHPNFIEAIVEPFSAAEVGAVDGHLLYLREDGSTISTSQSFYWRYELKLRVCESRLGILAVMSGPCMAVRKSLYKEIPENVGEDCVVPLDIVSQGYKVLHTQEAVAYDRMPARPGSEFRTRVRMTRRNWLGTWNRPRTLNIFRHSGYALALWSHKILRWLTPVFLLLMTLIAVFGSLLYESFVGCLLGLTLFYLSGLVGWLMQIAGGRLIIASTVYSFLLANLGFVVGLAQVAAGKNKAGTYK